MRPIFTEHYDLYQLDQNNIWWRIYRNLDKGMAQYNLNIERSEPTQKDRWKAKRIEIKTQEYETDL